MNEIKNVFWLDEQKMSLKYELVNKNQQFDYSSVLRRARNGEFGEITVQKMNEHTFSSDRELALKIYDDAALGIFDVTPLDREEIAQYFKGLRVANNSERPKVFIRYEQRIG